MNFQELYDAAHQVAHDAAQKMIPTPVAFQNSNLFDNKPTGEVFVLDEGACGFAWIQFAGNTAWGKWAKKNNLAHSAYPTGLHIWVSDYGQSMDRKEAYARAFAEVLRLNGIKAYSNSRMD